MSTPTKVVPHKYNNKPMFAVVDKDFDPNDEKARPLVSMGIKKAQYIMDHLEEFKTYVEENQ